MLRLNCLYCGQPLRLNYRLTGPLLVFLTVLLVFLPHSRSLCGCTAESLPRSSSSSSHSSIFTSPLLTLLPRTLCSTSPPKRCTLESARAPPPLHVPQAPPHVLRCHLPLLALLTTTSFLALLLMLLALLLTFLALLLMLLALLLTFLPLLLTFLALL